MNEKLEMAFVKPLISKMDRNWPLQAHHHKIIEHEDFKGDVLDIGGGCCEFAIVAKLVKPIIHMAVMDVNEFYMKLGMCLSKKAEAPIDLYAVAVENEPFKENSFDTINMSHVLEHVEDIDKMLQWVKKILRPNGTLFVAVPFGSDHDAPEHAHYFVTKNNITANTLFNGKQKCKNIVTLMKQHGFGGKCLIFKEYELDKRHCFPPNDALDILVIAKQGGNTKC